MKTLIEKLENEKDLWDEVYIPCDIERQEVRVMIDDAINGCIDIVKQHSDWVSVSERLPPVDTIILLTVEFMPSDWRVKTGNIDINGKWWVHSASWTPTHWQPLPQPPSEVQHG